VCTYEADFFTHREEELKCWPVFELCESHHSCYADAIIGPEGGFITADDTVFFYDCDSFCLPIVRIFRDADHVHMRLKTDFSVFISRCDD
jgi:hypothetical protein